MHVAILTFEGYAELDSLVAPGVLNRARTPDRRVTIAAPGAKVASMNGVAIERTATLEEASAADAVIVGSGITTREVVEDPAIRHILRRLAAGCLAAWIIARPDGRDTAKSALHSVPSAGEEEAYVKRAWRNITSCLPALPTTLA